MPRRRGIKAKNMNVYISGLHGKHPIDVGIAYFYRGHYIYGPVGNPLVPIPFAPKEIYLAGVAADDAPEYDNHDHTLVEEGSIAALHKSMVHEWQNMVHEGTAEASANTFHGQHIELKRLLPKVKDSGLQGNEVPLVPTNEAPSMPSVPAYTPPELDQPYNRHTPHLAASAPGSRQGTPTSENTPSYSRQISKNHIPGLGQTSGMRPVASMSRISHLMVRDGTHTSRSNLRESSSESIDATSMHDFSSGMLQPNSQPVSRPLSRIPSSVSVSNSDNWMNDSLSSRHLPRIRSKLSLLSDEYMAHSQPLSYTSNVASIWEQELVENGPSPPDSTSNPTSHAPVADKPAEPRHGYAYMDSIGTGCLQRDSMAKALRALNETYFIDHSTGIGNKNTPGLFRGNEDAAESSSSQLGVMLGTQDRRRVLKCPIHGEGCDGRTVTNPRMTEQIRHGKGIKGLPPMIEVNGQAVIDWYKVYLDVSSTLE